MLALIQRNLLLYFRNRSGVFFSLMGAAISFILYLIFLKQNMQQSWSQVPSASILLDTWLIGGTLAVTGMTTTLSSLSQKVIDREKQASLDLALTDAGPIRVELGYLISATLIGFCMQLVMFALMVGYFAVIDGLTVTVSQVGAVVGLMLVSALLATTINALIIQGVRSVDSLGKLGTIVGTASGFLVGTYLPIGSLPSFAQLLVKLTPGSYVAALYRQFLMTRHLNQALPQGQLRRHFERLLGVRLDWSGLLTQQQTYWIIGLILGGTLGLLVGCQVIIARRKFQLRRA